MAVAAWSSDRLGRLFGVVDGYSTPQSGTTAALERARHRRYLGSRGKGCCLWHHAVWLTVAYLIHCQYVRAFVHGRSSSPCRLLGVSRSKVYLRLRTTGSLIFSHACSISAYRATDCGKSGCRSKGMHRLAGKRGRVGHDDLQDGTVLTVKRPH